MTQQASQGSKAPALRLRECREKGAMTLSLAAESIGISATHLSRLEHGQRQPSIGVLLQLAGLYGVGVGELVGEEPPAAVKLVRAGSADERQGDDGTYSTLTGAAELNGLTAIQLDAVGPGSAQPAHHDDEEWMFVVSGWVKVELGRRPEIVTLEVGDSIHFDARTPHRLVDSDREGTRLIIVSTPLQRTDRKGHLHSQR